MYWCYGFYIVIFQFKTKEKFMAIPCYGWFKDEQGSDVTGSVNIDGREGSVEILGFDHELRIPIDSDTLTETRKHEPLLITKPYDSVTSCLYRACANGEMLKQLSLVWYKIDETGTEKEYFRHTLEDVKIIFIKPTMYDSKNLEKERYSYLEIVAMRYGKITWTYSDGNISFSDSLVENKCDVSSTT